MNRAKSLLIVAILSQLLATESRGDDAIRWRTNLDAAKVEAAQSKKLVMLHFYTSTCGPCRMLEQNVFSVPQFGEQLENNFVPVKVDANVSSALAQAYQVSTVPADVIVSPEGNVLAKLSCPQSASEYLGQLTKLSQHYQAYAAKNGHSAQPAVQSAYAGLKVGGYSNHATASSQPQVTQPTSPGSLASSNPYFDNRYTGVSPQAGNPLQQSNGQVQIPANAMPNSYRTKNAQAGTASADKGIAHQQPPIRPASPAVVQNQFANQPQRQAPGMANGVRSGSGITMTSHQSTTPQSGKTLPPGCPPVAFDGYCPVSLRAERKWVEGDLQYGAIHRGRTFLFASDQFRQQFLATPDEYCPVFSGMDPVLLLESNQQVEGSRKFGFDYQGAFYLFSSAETMQQFKSQPKKYAAGVRQAMAQLGVGTGATVK